MNKVYQTIIDKKKGNCMQAAFASLLDLELDQVPNFKEFNETWFTLLWTLLQENGYEHHGTLYNRLDGLKRGNVTEGYKDRFNTIKDMEGVNGLFYAAVYSPRFYQETINDRNPSTHAVIIDKNFNIVHDPNPLYKEITKYPEADEVGYNGIIHIHMIEKIKN
jgi:hypothetical protein